MNDANNKPLRQSRFKFLLVVAVFASPFLVALALNLGGWQPDVRGNGEPVLPQRNLAEQQVPVQLDNRALWPWRDSEPRLTLVALPGPGCASRCFDALTAVAKARVMLNQNQSRLRLLYLGPPPADTARLAAMRNYWVLGRDVNGALAEYRPSTPDSIAVLLVESNGTVLSLYRDGFDAAGLFRDMKKVIR